MLKAIRDFLDAALAPGDPRGQQHTIELATAALLVEVMRLDASVAPAARDAVLAAVRDKFGLSREEAQTLIDLAEQEARTANDYYQFTSIINQRFSYEQKVRAVELLWRVAYADSVLSAHETHLIRKLADLLYLKHADYINAKLRAREQAAPPAAAGAEETG
jgi:uncharacterized tellurite resistance protein B-like protein